ncbi:MAG: bacillithiol biosynthesis deacetylase BshB1 [Chitinophagaceae bacterium]|nr:MAG: GlcNAc-PI de-N-acetylase [Bacteroidetes bacterium OLB11]MCC6448584.1 bacillithiol biosynthesis deacetylase BshB1 [Chitinophagaceae bacterium]HMN32346.1 bacillithiol biosynthesis deacetylase BshB1 [Chitinophagaceae bacterium]
MKIDILAIVAHPDDAELSCSGTLMLHKLKGYKTGVVDLTQGELGSRGSVETRQRETSISNQILQLDVRENLSMRDGFFVNDEKHQLAIINILRKYQPSFVITNAPHDRHPDHGRAANLVKDACFYSGLIKIETFHQGEKQNPWRPKKVFQMIQDVFIEPDFIIDISSTIDQKIDSIKAYSSQFIGEENDGPLTYISSKQYIERSLYRSSMLGKRIGVQYGEGFIKTNSIGLNDFSSFILPEFV